MSLLLSPLDSKTKVFSSMLFLLNCSVLFISFGQPCQTPLSMGFPRQEYWSGLPFPSPGDLPNPGIKPWSPAWEADSLPSEPAGKPPPGMGKPLHPVSLINRFATWQRLDFSIFLVHTCPESLFSTPLKQESCTSTNLATLFFPPWMSIPVVRCL